MNKPLPLSFRHRARALWPLLLAYATAVLGGLVLVVAFSRFNALHEEFLDANYESVHSARTLLKAQYYVDLATRVMADAARDPNRRGALLGEAEILTLNAANYIDESREGDAKSRAEILQRLRAVQDDVARLRNAPDTAATEVAMKALQRLGRDLDAAEHDRWGNLSALNTALAARMRTMNEYIGASMLLFSGIMIVLGWALLRARRAEEALRTAKRAVEAIQRTTLDASPLGIAYIDLSDWSNRRVATVNRQMADIFGYEPDLMQGMSVRRLFAGQETFERLAATVPDRLRHGEVVREEVVMQRRDGKPFWCALSIKAIDPGDLAHGVVWNCEDISERKFAEDELLQARSRAESASRAKSEFLANMSHELRTPFTGLFGLLDLLNRTRLDETQKRYLGFARDSARQMQAIVNDILDFSKIEAGKLILEETPFDLRHLIESAVETHRTAAEDKGLRFHIDYLDPDPPNLFGDAVRIRQVLDNLIGNAVKFTEHGEVKLIVACEREGTGEAELRVTVADTGIGIADTMQERIFDKFTQADSSTTRLYGGTGLGLSISRQLATLMGGRVSLVSREGEGSRFTLQLRLRIAEILQAATAMPPESAYAVLHDLTIVLAEDNTINRDMVAELLGHYGTRVLRAVNGAEAVALADSERPDLILMDCQMPVMDGLEATRRIRSAEAGTPRHVPIVALTAFVTSGYRDDCLAAGMDRFVTKPISLDELVSVVASLRGASSTQERNESAPLSGRVLLVEDNLSIQEATRALIERAGCSVDVAGNGESALNRFRCNGGAKPETDFDLVLLDLNLPDLGGIEVCVKWREFERTAQLAPAIIVAATAHDRVQVADRCFEAGFNDILSKPFDERELRELLNKYLHD